LEAEFSSPIDLVVVLGPLLLIELVIIGLVLIKLTGGASGFPANGFHDFAGNNNLSFSGLKKHQICLPLIEVH
jgi:hypothetical protein